MYDGVRFGRIALQYPEGKADQQQLHLGISARRLIQALLGCPILSKWSTPRKKKKKKERKKKDDQNPVKNRTAVLLPGRPDPHESQDQFLPSFFSSNQQKQGDHRKVGSKRLEGTDRDSR